MRWCYFTCKPSLCTCPAMHSSGSTASNFCIFEVNWCRKDRVTLRYYSLVKKCLKNGDIVEVSARWAWKVCEGWVPRERKSAISTIGTCRAPLARDSPFMLSLRLPRACVRSLRKKQEKMAPVPQTVSILSAVRINKVKKVHSRERVTKKQKVGEHLNIVP